MEREILKKSNTDLFVLQLTSYKTKLDYCMNRFIDQFGQKLDKEKFDKYYKFHKHQSEEYSKITRLFRIIEAYKTK